MRVPRRQRWRGVFSVDHRVLVGRHGRRCIGAGRGLTASKGANPDARAMIGIVFEPNIGDREVLESTFGAECYNSYGFHEVHRWQPQTNSTQ